MTRFERNQTSIIDKEINEQTRLPKIGIVTQVYEHAGIHDDSNFEVDVEFDNGVDDETRVPVHTSGSGAIAPPKNGDKILIVYTEGDSNRPIAFGNGWSSTDRPPLGLAGMHRKEFESGNSPIGDGNIYVTGYTDYEDTVASSDYREIDPSETVVQIAKNVRGENVNPLDGEELSAKVEFYDSPENDAGHVSVELNMVNSNETDPTWGFKLDFKTGEFKLVDPNGYGITSDGFGNLTLEYNTLTENQTGDGSLSL